MSYRIEIKRNAQRDLRRLPNGIRNRLAAAVNRLADEPRPGGARRLRARLVMYRIRVGDYRVLYAVIDEQQLVVVGRIVKRSESTYRDVDELFGD